MPRKGRGSKIPKFIAYCCRAGCGKVAVFRWPASKPIHPGGWHYRCKSDMTEETTNVELYPGGEWIAKKG